MDDLERIGGAVYRQRTHPSPKSQDAWLELLRLGDEYNKLAADKGWAQGTYWMLVAGETELVAEWNYSDMSAFERETQLFRDPDMMAVAGKI